jgi:hypothetical protein
MKRSTPDIEYTEEEARLRMEAALRGARIAGHKPMESLTLKRPKAQRKEKDNSKAEQSK